MLIAIEKYIVCSEYNEILIAKLPADKITHAGDYPLRGKTTSLAKDFLEEKTGKLIAALGYGKTFITFRISHDLVNLDMNKIMKQLEEKFPGKKDINLTKEGFDKLLGSGNITRPLSIKVKAASQKAIDKISEKKGEVKIE